MIGRALVSLCLLPLALAWSTALAADLPALSFDSPGWELTKSAAIADGQLTLTGDPELFVRAELALPAESLKQAGQVILQADVQMENIKAGPKMYMKPKLRVLYGKGDKPFAKYVPDPLELAQWTTLSLPFEGKQVGGAKVIRVEFGLQNCTGVFRLRNPRFSTAAPTPDTGAVYPTPEKTSATLELSTQKAVPFSPLMLGLNSHFVWSPFGYEDPRIQKILRDLRVPHLRFPAGTVANFYDWRTDMPDFPKSLGDKIPGWIQPKREKQWKYGFTDYASLCRSLNIHPQLTFNVMWGEASDSAAWLADWRQKLPKFQWIELGNENYFPGQSLGHARNVQSYIAQTREMTKHLKQTDPFIKVAVNAEPETEAEEDYGPWSIALAAEDYYDGVVIHPYTSAGSFFPDRLSRMNLLRSYKIVRERINRTHEFFGRPLVISEWGVLGYADGLDAVDNPMAVLARAGCFAALVDGYREGKVVEACYHIFFNGKPRHNSALFLNDQESNTIFKTRRGVMYEMMIDAFLGSDLLEGHVQTAALEEGLPAVQVQATRRGDTIRLFAINRMDCAGSLVLSVDGLPYEGSYTIRTLDQQNGAKERFTIDENPCTIAKGTGPVRLPPYSLSVVELPAVRESSPE